MARGLSRGSKMRRKIRRICLKIIPIFILVWIFDGWVGPSYDRMLAVYAVGQICLANLTIELIWSIIKKIGS